MTERVSPLQLGLGALAGVIGVLLAFFIFPGLGLPQSEAQGSLGPVERDLQQLQHPFSLEFL